MTLLFIPRSGWASGRWVRVTGAGRQRAGPSAAPHPTPTPHPLLASGSWRARPARAVVCEVWPCAAGAALGELGGGVGTAGPRGGPLGREAQRERPGQISVGAAPPPWLCDDGGVTLWNPVDLPVPVPVRAGEDLWTLGMRPDALLIPLT